MKRRSSFLQLLFFACVLVFTLLLPQNISAAPAEVKLNPEQPVSVIKGNPLQVYVTAEGWFGMIAPDRSGHPLATVGAFHLWTEECMIAPQMTSISSLATGTWNGLRLTEVAGEGSLQTPWKIGNQLNAVCGIGAEAMILTTETHISYVNGDDFVHLDGLVCGGSPGGTVTTALLTNEKSGEAARSSTQFDADGCAHFDVVWDFATGPVTPTSLELVSISTSNTTTDATFSIGMTLAVLLFLTLIVLWWLLVRPAAMQREL